MSSGGPPKAAESAKKKARIEIIPLIDVIFFLLATFVLFTLSLNRITSLPVNLPIANPTPQPPRPDDVKIQVSDGDTIYWNRQVYVIADLPSKLKTYKESVPEPHILVAGDQSAMLGSTIKVLDQLRLAGFKASQFSVETQDSLTGH